MIGDALEISIVVSMAVLIGYPSMLLLIEALQTRRKRAVARRRMISRPPRRLP